MDTVEEARLIAAAKGGDEAAFGALTRAHSAKLRAVVRRLVGHPEDTDDLVQEALVKAWRGIGAFRGDAAFSTWLCAIGARTARDHLRAQAAWRPRAQVAYANACAASEALSGEVGAAVMDPNFAYDVHEHIAFCLVCVGRSLPPEGHAALVLREVMGFTNREAAEALDLSEGAFRGRLAQARETMTTEFEGLCALVNKTGVCRQCKGLREATPADRRGAEAPQIASLDARLAIARAADIERGASQRMHDVFWRRVKEIEAEKIVSDAPQTDCGA